MTSTRATFVMEQHLGHRTFYENLRRAVEADGRLDASWIEIRYEAGSAGGLARVPGLPDAVRGPLDGRAEARQLLGSGADVAFFNTQVPAALAGRSVRRLPYVLCTDITPLQYDRHAEQYGHRPDGPVVGPLKHRLNRQVFQRSAAVVGWSNWVRDSLVEEYGVSPGTARVIAPGVDLHRWSPRSEPRSPGPVRMLFVGGDFERKGGRDLIECFRRLPAGAAELHVVTRTPVSEVGVTVHTGLVPNSHEILALYRSCDLFVLPTHGEAFGIAAAEAAASGLPIVATAVGGLPDIVDEGTSGYLVAAHDVDALTDRVRTLVADEGLRVAMGSAGRARAERCFDAGANGRAIVDLLLEVAHATEGSVGDQPTSLS